MKSTGPARAILWAGLLCGLLDIGFVIAYYGTTAGAPPTRILQSVAAGLLGRQAATAGGVPTAALGLFLHFVISFGAAAVFYLASRRVRFLTRHALAAGVLYGAAVWLFMQLVVLPLSAVPPARFPPPAPWPVIIAHLTCVGPPIALAVRRWGSPVR
ncbi:MAG TPA: hypothetical protein VEB66_12860 [Opitutaceae bacterium]|nr:hypothetical protein [Opitutaceae bacterium]